jgi:hypothetical protein
VPPKGALLQSLNDDTAAYQKAVSERLGIFTQHSATFIVGFIVAFWRGACVRLGVAPMSAVVVEC